MRTHVELRSGAYADSVTLLQVSRDVAATDGVLAAQVAMATPLNVEVLGGMGFEVPAASPNDMVVALRAHDDDALARGLAAVDRSLAAAVRRPSGPTGDGGSHRTAPRRPRCARRPAGWYWCRRRARARRSRRWTPSTPAPT